MRSFKLVLTFPTVIVNSYALIAGGLTLTGVTAQGTVTVSCGLTVGVLAFSDSSGSPAMLLRLEEVLIGRWLPGETVRRDTKDTDASHTATNVQ